MTAAQLWGATRQFFANGKSNGAPDVLPPTPSSSVRVDIPQQDEDDGGGQRASAHPGPPLPSRNQESSAARADLTHLVRQIDAYLIPASVSSSSSSSAPPLALQTLIRDLSTAHLQNQLGHAGDLQGNAKLQQVLISLGKVRDSDQAVPLLRLARQIIMAALEPSAHRDSLGAAPPFIPQPPRNAVTGAVEDAVVERATRGLKDRARRELNNNHTDMIAQAKRMGAAVLTAKGDENCKKLQALLERYVKTQEMPQQQLFQEMFALFIAIDGSKFLENPFVREMIEKNNIQIEALRGIMNTALQGMTRSNAQIALTIITQLNEETEGLVSKALSRALEAAKMAATDPELHGIITGLTQKQALVGQALPLITAFHHLSQRMEVVRGRLQANMRDGMVNPPTPDLDAELLRIQCELHILFNNPQINTLLDQSIAQMPTQAKNNGGDVLARTSLHQALQLLNQFKGRSTVQDLKSHLLDPGFQQPFFSALHAIKQHYGWQAGALTQAKAMVTDLLGSLDATCVSATPLVQNLTPLMKEVRGMMEFQAKQTGTGSLPTVVNGLGILHQALPQANQFAVNATNFVHAIKGTTPIPVQPLPQVAVPGQPLPPPLPQASPFAGAPIALPHFLQAVHGRLTTLRPELENLLKRAPFVFDPQNRDLHLRCALVNGASDISALLSSELAAQLSPDERNALTYCLHAFATLNQTVIPADYQKVQFAVQSIMQFEMLMDHRLKGSSAEEFVSWCQKRLVNYIQEGSNKVASLAYSGIAQSLFEFVRYLYNQRGIAKESPTGQALERLLYTVEAAQKKGDFQSLIEVGNHAIGQLRQLGLRIHAYDVFAAKPIEKNYQTEVSINQLRQQTKANLYHSNYKSNPTPEDVKAGKEKLIKNYSALATLQTLGKIFRIRTPTDDFYLKLIQTSKGNQVALKENYFTEISKQMNVLTLLAVKVSYVILSFFIKGTLANYYNNVFEAGQEGVNNQAKDQFAGVTRRGIHRIKSLFANINTIGEAYGNPNTKPGGSKDEYESEQFELPVFNDHYHTHEIYQNLQNATVNRFYTKMGWSKQALSWIQAQAKSAPGLALEILTAPVWIPFLIGFGIIERFIIDWPFAQAQKFVLWYTDAVKNMVTIASNGIKDRRGFGHLTKLLEEQMLLTLEEMYKAKQQPVTDTEANAPLSESDQSLFRGLLYEFLTALAKEKKYTREQIYDDRHNPSIFRILETHLDNVFTERARDEIITRLANSLGKNLNKVTFDGLIYNVITSLNKLLEEPHAVAAEDNERTEKNVGELAKAIAYEYMHDAVSKGLNPGVEAHQQKMNEEIVTLKQRGNEFIQLAQPLFQQLFNEQSAGMNGYGIAQLYHLTNQYVVNAIDANHKVRGSRVLDERSRQYIDSHYDAMNRNYILPIFSWLAYLSSAQLSFQERQNGCYQLYNAFALFQQSLATIQPNKIENIELEFVNAGLKFAEDMTFRKITQATTGFVGMVHKPAYVSAAMRKAMLEFLKETDPHGYEKKQKAYRKKMGKRSENM